MPSRLARRGVSLLELLLALGLSVIVMALIGMSINLNFRMYDTKRTSIEESRLARAVLRHMADDIRAAVQSMPPDLSGLETVLGNSQNASSALGGAGLGALAGAAGQTGGATGAQSGGQTGSQSGQQAGSQTGTGGGGQTGTGTGGQTGTGGSSPPTTTGTTGGVDPQTAEAGSIYGEQQAGGVIGLYGTSTELQIDISRLPRVDQFQAPTDPNNLTAVVDIPSDMKTVTYFLRPEEGLTEVGTDGRGRGLMRRVLDRAVSNWEMQNGGTSNLGQLEMMAEEVVGLQFMYFDGASWTSDWDSASMEGLPVAIEITVILKSLADQQEAKTTTTLTTSEEDNERLYTLTVNLPTATSLEEKQLAAEEKTALAQTGEVDTSGDAAAAGAGAGAGGMPSMGGGNKGGDQGKKDDKPAEPKKDDEKPKRQRP